MNLDISVGEFLSKENRIAIVGVSENKQKWGYRIYKTMKDNGYRVYPINPKHTKIDGDICYKSISDLPFVPDLVITVVPPKITESVVLEAYKKGVKKIWMQPGSESNTAIEMCKMYGIKEMHEMCFVVDGMKVDFSI